MTESYSFSIKTPGVVSICIGEYEQQSYSHRMLKDKIMRVKMSRWHFRTDAEFEQTLNMYEQALAFLDEQAGSLSQPEAM